MAEAPTPRPGRARATVAVDTNGILTGASPTFLEWLGESADSLAGARLDDLLALGDSGLVTRLDQGFRRRGTPSPVPVTFVRPSDGTHIAAELRVLSRRPMEAALSDDSNREQLIVAVRRLPDDATTSETASVEDRSVDVGAVVPDESIAAERGAVRAAALARGTNLIAELGANDVVWSISGNWHGELRPVVPQPDLVAPPPPPPPTTEPDMPGRSSHDRASIFFDWAEQLDDADQLWSAVDAACERADATEFEASALGQVSGVVHVEPIPSAQVIEQNHALLSFMPSASTSDDAASMAGLAVLPDDDEDLDREGVVDERTADSAEAADPLVPLTRPNPSAALRRAHQVAVDMDDEAAAATKDLDQPNWGLFGGALFLTYVALQGLYLGPLHDWPSPFNGVLESQRCLIEPLCDNQVLTLNHLATLALLSAIVAFLFAFRSIGAMSLPTARPQRAAELAPSTTRGSRAALHVAAIGLTAALVVQTIVAPSASRWLWIAACTCGALAAWATDREAGRPEAGTIAALTLALSCLLVPLGIGTIWLGSNRLPGLVILLGGAALFWRALRLNRVSESSFDAADYVAMLGLGVLTVVLGLARHHSWRYAFVGDEWTFYEGAVDHLHGVGRIGTFEIGGPNDYFTGLTFEMQAAVMQIAGDDVWGWRLSALLPMVLSVPAMYAFTRWLSGRAAALIAAVALGAGHMLLSFSMVGYNNSQSLVAVSASFAALAWAHQRPSALRFVVLGLAAGSTFLVYAMARLALLPLGLLFLALFRHEVEDLWRRIGWSALGAVAMAAPALFSARNWEALLKATPVEAEDPVLASGGVGRQVAENMVEGWLSFIGNQHNTHFIVGPHLDVISAGLLIVGLGYALARSRHDAVLRWFLVGGVGLWTLINAVQQYAQISNTRSFMIPIIYCVLIGVAGSVVLSLARQHADRFKQQPGALAMSVGVLAVALVALNQWHISAVANERQQLTPQTMLVQQLEYTQSDGGHGMAAIVAWPENRNERLTMVLDAHGVASERVAIVPNDGEVNLDLLCGRREPFMFAAHWEYPQAREWADALAACWSSTVVTIVDPHGAPKLLRVVNAAGLAEFEKPQSERANVAASTDAYRLDYAAYRPIDVAIDGAGVAYALTRGDRGALIHRLDNGESISLAQSGVIDFDITADGLFVVAANGSSDRLVWYDGKGNTVARYPGQSELPEIGGLAVDGDRLWFSDSGKGRLIAVDPTFIASEVRFAQGTLAGPSTIAVGADDSVWVHNARSGNIVRVSANDEPVVEVRAEPFSPSDAPRLQSTRDGWLIRPVTSRPAVELIDTNGVLIDLRGGALQPQAVAAFEDELLVLDRRWNHLPVLGVEARWQAPTRGVVAWGQRSLDADSLNVLASPFVGEDLSQPGPVSTELIATSAIDTAAGQRWRPLGAALIGEVHAVTTWQDAGFAADVNGRIFQLDGSGETTGVVGVGSVGTTFVSDIVAGPTGDLWVLDAGAGRLLRVNAQNEIADLTSDSGVLRNARGIGAGANDTRWVASTAGAQLTQIDANGVVVSVVPLEGRQPSDVVELNDGSLWFVDAQDMQLVRVDRSGSELASVALASFTSLESPHLALADDVLWVTVPEGSAVLGVDPESGATVVEPTTLVGPDGAPLRKPIGIATRPDGSVLIVDSTNAAILTLTPAFS